MMKTIFAAILSFITVGTFAQPGSDIYLFDLKIKKGEALLSNPVNITNRKGYDNQPSFDADNSLVSCQTYNVV